MDLQKNYAGNGETQQEQRIDLNPQLRSLSSVRSVAGQVKRVASQRVEWVFQRSCERLGVSPCSKIFDDDAEYTCGSQSQAENEKNVGYEERGPQ